MYFCHNEQVEVSISVKWYDLQMVLKQWLSNEYGLNLEAAKSVLKWAIYTAHQQDHPLLLCSLTEGFFWGLHIFLMQQCWNGKRAFVSLGFILHHRANHYCNICEPFTEMHCPILSSTELWWVLRGFSTGLEALEDYCCWDVISWIVLQLASLSEVFLQCH